VAARRTGLFAGIAIALVAGVAVLFAGATAPGRRAARDGAGVASSAGGGPPPHLPPLDPVVRRRVVLGRSVRRRPIVAIEQGDPDTPVKILVVGSIHGNEPAGITVAHHLERLPLGAESDRWIIDDLNPDGAAADTRQNARGVDLNRNFPYAWRRLGRRGDQQFSGAAPLSEPESRIAHALILRLQPAATVWFHQPLGVVDESGGSLALERRFASLGGLPTRRLARYPGSAVGWQNHRLPRTTAFVVELPAGPVPGRRLAHYEDALLALPAILSGRGPAKGERLRRSAKRPS
jgi:protein MpaA